MIHSPEKADVVICGAGIAGIASAYFLARHHSVRDILIVDERPPLSLTSDKSSEGYRNWWPGPGDAMVRFMDRSVDLLESLAEESNNRFHLNRRGYVFLTADPNRAEIMQQEAGEIAELGAGPLRLNEGYEIPASDNFSDHPRGADLIRDSRIIRSTFPFIAEDTVALLHARRCGWLSAQQLGMYLLEQTRAAGTRLLNAKVTRVTIRSNRIEAIEVQSGTGRSQIKTGAFVIAAGPMLAEVARLLDVNLPVYNEPHGKISFEDTRGIIDRSAPMMIWNDPVFLSWNDAERAELAAHEDTAWLLEEFPAGLHFRPEGGRGSQTILAVWPYHITSVKSPVWPIRFESEFYEIIMRGLVRIVPGITTYLDRMGRPIIDGGYYCKTRENRPLICPLPVTGTFVIGALSGFGIMAAPAAAELLSAQITGSAQPTYAPAFDLLRYQDPDYQVLLETWDPTAGQL